MGKQYPGKYKRRCSFMRKASRSQRLRYAREKMEKGSFLERQNKRPRENDNVTVFFVSTNPSSNPLLECENFTIADFWENSVSRTPIAPSLSAPLGRRGKVSVTRVLNKLFASAPPLGKNVTVANVFTSPSLSASSGRRGKARVARVFSKLSTNALLGKNLTIPRFFNNPSLSALLGMRGEMTVACVFDGPSASTLLGKSVTIPFNNPSLNGLFSRRENMTVACVMKKSPKISLGRNGKVIAASISAPLGKSENVAVNRAVKKPSRNKKSRKSERLTLASVSNNYSTAPTGESENVTLAKVLHEPLPNSLPIKDETHRDEQAGAEMSQARSHGASTNFPKQASDAIVVKKSAKTTKHPLRHMTPVSENDEAGESIDLNKAPLPQITISHELSYEHQLEIEHNIQRAEDKFPNGRFLCDLKFVIRQVREIEAHSTNCKFGGKLTYYRMTKDGLVCTFYYSCSSPACDANVKLVTDKEGENLNRLAVLGAASTGSGFSQEKEKFRVMDLQYMSKSKYKQCDKLTREVVKFSDNGTMTEEITVSNQMPLLVEPKIEMDFYVDETY